MTLPTSSLSRRCHLSSLTKERKSLSTRPGYNECGRVCMRVAAPRADPPPLGPLGTPLGGSRISLGSRQPCPSARFGDRDDLTNARAPRMTSLKRPGLAISPGPAHCTQVPGTWQP